MFCQRWVFCLYVLFEVLEEVGIFFVDEGDEYVDGVYDVVL